MNRILIAVLLIFPTLALAVDTRQTRPTTNVIAELATKGGDHYFRVTLTKRSGDRITIQHDEGIATQALTDLDPAGLDHLFPGLLANRIAQEAARRQAEEQPKRRLQEDQRLIESKIRQEVAEALRASDENKEKEPVVCILVSGRDTYESGENVQFAVRLLNRSARKVYLVGSLDGSAHGRRLPLCQFEVAGPAGNPVRLLGNYCNNMNELRPEDFVAVPAGEVFDPFGKGFYPASPLPGQEPGKFTVRFLYSTSSHRIGDYLGNDRMAVALSGTKDPGKSETQRLFEQMTHAHLTSKELKITFQPKSR